jgi:hypothetical protein
MGSENGGKWIPFKLLFHNIIHITTSFSYDRYFELKRRREKRGRGEEIGRGRKANLSSI